MKFLPNQLHSVLKSIFLLNSHQRLTTTTHAGKRSQIVVSFSLISNFLRLGAWWLGWMILAVSLFGFAFIMCMFPKQLPRAALRKRIASERRKRGMKSLEKETDHDEIPASLSDMLVTFKRLFLNVTFMLNNLASIFYYFGYMRKFANTYLKRFLTNSTCSLLDFHSQIY
jgi:hypothetical protein